MFYCTKPDLLREFTEAELIQRTGRGSGLMDDTVLNGAITRACAEIDSYLVRQHDLPLAAVPVVLVGISCDMTRYYLYQDLDDVSVVKTRYQSAIAFLKQVAAGTASLGMDSNSAVPSPQTVVVSVSSPKLFGRLQ